MDGQEKPRIKDYEKRAYLFQQQNEKKRVQITVEFMIFFIRKNLIFVSLYLLVPLSHVLAHTNILHCKRSICTDIIVKSILSSGVSV